MKVCNTAPLPRYPVHSVFIGMHGTGIHSDEDDHYTDNFIEHISSDPGGILEIFPIAPPSELITIRGMESPLV